MVVGLISSSASSWGATATARTLGVESACWEPSSGATRLEPLRRLKEFSRLTEGSFVEGGLRLKDMSAPRRCSFASANPTSPRRRNC
eukprot:2370480-Prymnesium_polylepis.1